MRTFTLILFFVILLLPLQLLSQPGNGLRVDSEKFLQGRLKFEFNPNAHIKHKLQPDNINYPKSKTIINKEILNNGFLLFEEIWQEWDGISWVNSRRWTYTYDVNNDMIEALGQTWRNSSGWENFLRHIYTYDINNNMIEDLFQEWYSNWVNYQKYSYTYDVNNNLIEQLMQYWFSIGSHWSNSSLVTYTYDVNNNRIEILLQDWDGISWVNSSRGALTYDVNNNLIEALYKIWDDSVWVDNSKDAYTYDENNNLIEILVQVWDVSDWVNFYRYVFTYDMSNNMIEELEQDWDVSDWVNTWKYVYIYDANNNKISELKQSWNGIGWGDYILITYTYVPTGIEQQPDVFKSFSLSNNYPNPFNPSTKIKYSIPKTSQVQIKVFDVLGNEIETLVNEEKPSGTYELTWNAAGLPNGVYFYQLKAREYTSVKKMILLK